VEALAAAPEAAEAAAGVTRSLNCFAAGTPVQMADGTTKPIERVREGDLVKSRNPATGVTEAKQVTETFSHVAPQVLTLTLSDPKTGLPVEHLVCTPEHPFYVDGKGFVLAGDLGIGTSLVTRAGPCLTLCSVEWQRDAAGAAGGARVYNFTVTGDHTYFVGNTGGGAWVHNDSFPIKVVPGGEGDDLAQVVANHRSAKGLAPLGAYGNNNLALFEYEETVDGQTVTRLKGFRSNTSGHAENNGLKHFRDRGMLDKVTRVYSEYHPCANRGHMCLRNLRQEVPRAKLYYSLRYRGRG